MTHVTLTAIVAIAMLAACAPERERQSAGRHGPATEHAADAALAADTAAAKDTVKSPTHTVVVDHDDDAGKSSGKASYDDDDSPMQSPGQSPTQSPFQGQPPALAITGLTVSGNGCAADTVAINVSDDARAFTALFADFIAELDPDATAGKDGMTRTSRRCRLALQLAVPRGYQVTALTTDLRGFVELEAGATAKLTNGIGFAGQTTKTYVHTFSGPASEDIAVRDEVNLKTWSACGGTSVLNIDVRADLAAQAGATALLALDSADGELTQTYALGWRRCH